MNTTQIVTGFVYLWRDKKHNRYCIGSHFGSLNDQYITSTGYMLRAYKKRPEDFKRRILYYHYSEDRKELLEKEQHFLNMIKDGELFHTSKPYNKYYNIKKNAAGLSGKVASDLRTAYWESDRSKEHREKLSNMFKTNNPHIEGFSWNRGEKCPQISEGRKKGKKPYIPKEQRSAMTKECWERGVYDNRPAMTEEHKAKISASNTGKKQTDYQKQRVSETQKGKIVSKETKQLISDTVNKIDSCKYCNFIGKTISVRRWHNERCKHKII